MVLGLQIPLSPVPSGRALADGNLAQGAPEVVWCLAFPPDFSLLFKTL
jgi:hypothetical protein